MKLKLKRDKIECCLKRVTMTLTLSKEKPCAKPKKSGKLRK